MQKIVVENGFVNSVSGLTENAVLCDKSGFALGLFHPLDKGIRPEDLQLEPPRSAEELQERQKVKTGKPLEEILIRLGL